MPSLVVESLFGAEVTLADETLEVLLVPESVHSTHISLKQTKGMAHGYKHQTRTHINYSAEQYTLNRITFAASPGGRRLPLLFEWVASIQQWVTLNTYVRTC